MEMSRFDIQKTQRTPEEWSAIAFKQTTENGLQWKIAMGVIVAAIATSATSPLTGLLIFGWTIYNGIQKAKEVQRNQSAIRDYGCVAHVLEGDDFRGYLQQVGEHGVKSELKFAQSQGYSVSDSALDYMEEGMGNGEQEIAKYLPIPSHQPPTPITQQPITNTQSSIHENTNIFDITKAISSPVQNCIILGVGGSGKGILVSNALRRIKAENPSRKIFYVDPKNEPKEYGYTEGVVDIVKRKTCSNKCPEEICDWLDEVLDEYIEWVKDQPESLLVIDEGMVIGDACKKTKNTRISTLILHIASLGGAKRENVWLVTQTPFVGAMGLNLTSSSQMKWVTLIGENDAGVLKQWSKTSTLENISLEKLNSLTQESPVNRAVYWGGHSKWYALPELTNYSQIDRDNNKPVGDALTSQERESLRGRTTELMIEKLERTKHLNLNDFIAQELGETERVEEVKEAIVRTIQKANHGGLMYKFKIN